MGDTLEFLLEFEYKIFRNNLQSEKKYDKINFHC